MKFIHIFTKPDCPDCLQLKAMLEKSGWEGMPYAVHDIETANGLAQFSFFGSACIGMTAMPIIVVEFSNGREVAVNGMDNLIPMVGDFNRWIDQQQNGDE